MEEIKHNEFINEKHKKTCRNLNCVEHLLILASTVTGFVSICSLTSLISTAVSVAKVKICVITSGIKKYESIIKKKKKKHDKIVLLGKDNLNTMNLVIPKALIDSYISWDEFVSVNNLLREYNEMKEEIKTSGKASVEYNLKI